MIDSRDTESFASQLLRQDAALGDPQYQDYRRKLEQALATAERRERFVSWVCATALVVSLALMFVGGSKIIGDFDPSSKGANFWSVTAGLIYLLATVIFFLSAASYYSRFRPGARKAKEELRDAGILELQRQVSELRKRIAPPSPDHGPEADRGRSAERPR